jgi:hypothetical protein
MTKLPAGRLARHAYLDAIGNWRGLVRVGGPWLLLAWALLLLARGGSALFTAAADLAATVGAAAVAVAWHRHILLGEPLTQRMAPLDARVARYFALTVLLALLVGAAPLLALLLLGGGAALGEPGGDAVPGGGGGAGLALLLVPATVLACLYVALRLQLIFPATAIEDRGMTLASSWGLTRGNGWRLFAGFLMATLPAALAAVLATLFLSWAAAATGSVVLGALADLAAVANPWLQAPLIAAFLSYVFIFLRQGGGAGDRPTVPTVFR